MNEEYNQNNYESDHIMMQEGLTPDYSQQQMRMKGDGIGFGIASFVLGVVSVFLFGCCVNYILAILAIAFAVVQMVKNKPKGLAIAGIATAGVSIILGTLMWIGVFVNIDWNDLDSYRNPYQFYNEQNLYEHNLEEYLNEL